MTMTDERPYASRLAIRFALILALAMLPAGIVAFVQTKALESEVQARSEVGLMGAALQAAAPETDLIGRVRGMVASLATAVPYVLDDPAACNRLMAGVATAEPTASLVAFVPLSGKMTCSSVGQQFDFAGSEMFDQVINAKAPSFAVNRNGPVSGTSILGISHPVFDSAATYIGYVIVSLPHDSLKVLGTSAQVDLKNPNVPVVFWTFDKEGVVLTSNLDLAEIDQHLPVGRPLQSFVGGENSVFQAPTAEGNMMTYAVVPIVRGDLYLIGSFVPEQPALAQIYGFSIYLPTLLMWMVGLIVSGLAAEMLVTRHIRTLNRSFVSFARGDRRLQTVDLKNAPAELNELAAAYVAMTEGITRSEAELEDSVHQKEVLLREVHHRVKNNLQLISSIMNIQIRSARGGEAKDLLKNLQERIMSLATVHRGLYQTSGLTDVRARELIPDIVRQIMAMSSGPEKPFDTQTDIDDLRLVPDQAVPLSLLLAEAMTNAIKHAGATRQRPGRLIVRLKRSGGTDAMLEVQNSTHLSDMPASAGTNTGIGSQLINAFVHQLGGRQDSGPQDGDYSLRVVFTVSPLSLAENQQVSQGLDAAMGNASAH